MKSIFLGAFAATLALSHAFPSPSLFKSRQAKPDLKNCNEAFFNKVIADNKLGGKLAPKSPYTPDTEPYEGTERVLYFANHEIGLSIDDICGVRVMVTDNIAFELYLPNPTKWNKRFLTVGNGGFGGRTNRKDMFARAVYDWAAMSTNVGHEDASTSLKWAHNQPGLQEDWAYRAMQASVPYAKALVSAYYANTKSLGNYYSGCSTGGRQGIRQIEVDPTSFDGMLIGAPAWNIKGFVPVISRIGVLADTYNLKNTLADSTLLGRIAQKLFAVCNSLDGSAGDMVIRDSDACVAAVRKISQNSTEWAGNNISLKQVEGILAIVGQDFTNPKAPGFVGDRFDITGIYDMTNSAYLWDKSLTENFNQQFAQYFLDGTVTTGTPLVWDADDNGAWLIGNMTSWDERFHAQADPAKLAGGSGGYQGKTILYTGTGDGFLATNGTRRAFTLAGGSTNPNLAYFEIPGMSHCVDFQTGTGTSVNPPWYIGGVGLHLPPGNVTYMSRKDLVNAQHDALMALAEWHESGPQGKRPESLLATAFERWGPGELKVSKKRPVCRVPKRQTLLSGGEARVNNETAWSCQ